MSNARGELVGEGPTKEIALERLVDDETKSLTGIDVRLLAITWKVDVQYSGKRGRIKGEGTSADSAVQNALSHVKNGTPEGIESYHFSVIRPYEASQQAVAQATTKRRPTSGATPGDEYTPATPLI